jgi:hypothetical protein
MYIWRFRSFLTSRFLYVSLFRPGGTSSFSGSSLLGVNDEVEPNPPIVEGTDQALALLVPLVNPPKSGFEGVLSFDSVFFGVSVKDPNILVACSETVFATLVAAFLTTSGVVAGSTWDGAGVACSWARLGM